MSIEFSGGCLCGAVRYTCAAEPAMAGHCHCEDCRRSSGTAHCSHMGVPQAALKLSGQLSSYARPAASGNVVTRHFCPTCGSPIYSTNSGIAGLAFLRASSLDDMEVFKPQMHVFVARAPSWDRPSGGLPAFDEMPPGM